MKTSPAKLGYATLLVAVVALAAMVHAVASSPPTVFHACLTPGGTLAQVSITSAPACPGGTVAVSWNEPATAAGGGLSGTQEFAANASFTVPAGVQHVMVEAWGGGGGGGTPLQFPDCVSAGGGGGGGYVRAVIAVTPGESLGIVVGAGGAPGAAGGASAVNRGSTALLSAGGGGGATTNGGAGGTVSSASGILRAGNAGGSGQVDFMCQFGPGNPPSTPTGTPGPAIQGSVGLPSGGSAGGAGAGFADNFVAGAGGAGEVILTW